MAEELFTTVTDRDPDSMGPYCPLARCKGKLLIVRPLEYQKEGFTTVHKPEGTDVVFADIAVLDEIRPAVDADDNDLPGFPAGQQFRNQAILQGYLKGTFKRYIGKTLIGTIYNGVATKGKPPMMWQDLSGDAGQLARGQKYLALYPDFLIPVAAQITTVEPEISYVQPAAGVAPNGQAARPANTLEQMRAMAAANAAGNFTEEPPF